MPPIPLASHNLMARTAKPHESGRDVQVIFGVFGTVLTAIGIILNVFMLWMTFHPQSGSPSSSQFRYELTVNPETTSRTTPSPPPDVALAQSDIHRPNAITQNNGFSTDSSQHQMNETSFSNGSHDPINRNSQNKSMGYETELPDSSSSVQKRKMSIPCVPGNSVSPEASGQLPPRSITNKPRKAG
ncbi:MAG: hypothetical protein M1834_007860 [Cirrosporium novae-zelandiae]|nr:MAG: hypothetical protein M1834_007860 [Cirrosporium novae-zelandiae]